MSTNQLTCPKCSESMVQGFLIDRGHYNAITVGNWAEGHPQKYWLGGIKTPKEKKIPIGAFRCPSCGYVELYASDVFAPRK
jgi:hypothetical protein